MVAATALFAVGLGSPYLLRAAGRWSAPPRMIVAGHLASLVLTWLAVLALTGSVTHPGVGPVELCRALVAAVVTGHGWVAAGPTMLAVALLAGRATLVAARTARDGRQLRRTFGVPIRRVPLVELRLPSVACTVGTVRPQILVDPTRLAELRPHEREAVLAHEQAHARGFHGLMAVTAHALAAGLSPLPSAHLAAAEVRRHLEAAADDAAARRTDRRTVASAIVEVACGPPPTTAALGATGWAAWRVDRLLTPPEQRCYAAAVVIATVGLAGIVVLHASTHLLHAATGSATTLWSAACCMT